MSFSRLNTRRFMGKIDFFLDSLFCPCTRGVSRTQHAMVIQPRAAHGTALAPNATAHRRLGGLAQRTRVVVIAAWLGSFWGSARAVDFHDLVSSSLCRGGACLTLACSHFALRPSCICGLETCLSSCTAGL